MFSSLPTCFECFRHEKHSFPQLLRTTSIGKILKTCASQCFSQKYFLVCPHWEKWRTIYRKQCFLVCPRLKPSLIVYALKSFSGHCNAITALEVDVQHHLVISSSTDKTIRLWCLETLAQTYVLETGEEVHHMELMTSQRLFYQSGEHIRVWNLNHFHTLFTVLGFEIVTSRRVVSRGFPTRLLLQGKDGAIRIVSPSDGTIITTMFPLETLPESIVDYAYSPRENKLYVVLSSGAILVFNTRSNPCRSVIHFDLLVLILAPQLQSHHSRMVGSDRLTHPE